MRHLAPHALWIGHGGVRSEPAPIHAEGIRAVIDPAIEDPAAALAREIACRRIRFVDGSGELREIGSAGRFTFR